MIRKSDNKRLKLSNFKLNSLLDITQAINENLPTQQLLERYEKILRDELGIGKILIYKHSDVWDCIFKSGVDDETASDIIVAKDLISFKELAFISASNNQTLEAFDILLPVYNNNEPLAFVLIGDIDEEAEGVSPTIKHLNFIQTISNIIIVAIENIRLFNESLRQEAIRKELELASKMQNMLIPDSKSLPQNENLGMVAFYHPHMDVGGDYYDCIELSDHEIGFCIADVSGKGISAAILMSNFQANLRALFTHDTNLPALVEKLNQRVLSAANGEKFITLFIGKYNYKTKELEYINAAHNPPLLYEVESNRMTKLTTGCVGMGMLDELPIVKRGFISITEKSKILCYTDGLVEIIAEEDVQNDTDDIERIISNNKSMQQNITDIIKELKIDDVNKAIFDDITMLGIEIF